MVRRVTLLGALLTGAVFLTGCPSPNTYGTPRTTPKGKIQHSIAAEAYGYTTEVEQADGSTVSSSATVPTLPTYTIRFGVADEVDIGARLANMTSIAGDVKWNFVKGQSFDMALDPGLQWFNVLGLHLFYFQVPVLFGINFSEAVTMVLIPGVTYALATGDVDPTADNDNAVTADGLFLRGGIGFDFRLSEGFALHPEVTIMKSLTEDDSTLVYQMGLGFNFGKLPEYGVQ